MTTHHDRSAAAAPPSRGPRGSGVLILLAALAAFAFIGLVSLGNWQVERRAWKHDLIERVQARVHAPPAALPDPSLWPSVAAAQDEYRRVQVSGTYDHQKETLVQATTALGGGFWVMTPLHLSSGGTVLINRGFVPPERRDPAARGEPPPQGPVTLTGLLRLSEPEGGFLRKNDPAADRWHSRDVAAILQARGLGVGTAAPQPAAPGPAAADPASTGPAAPQPAASFFIDAEAGAAPVAGPDTRTWPAAGLTVVSFTDNHLVYAVTWYILALMVAGAAFYVIRDEMRLRRQA